MNTRMVLLAATTVLAASCAQMSQSAHTGKIEEQRLGPVPEDRQYERTTDNGRHIAWLIQRGSKWIAVVDGVEGPEYDEIGSHTREPNAPAVERDERLRKNLEMLPLPSQQSVDRLSCTSDGRRFAYKARTGDKWCAIIDGKVAAAYDEVGMPDFAPDDRRV